jgi:septum formation protein
MNSYSLILASQSPRRKELLGYLNIPFKIIVSDVNEDSKETSPQKFCETIARRKGEVVFQQLQKQEGFGTTFFPFVISSDTIVYCDQKIYGKPTDREEASKILMELSGKCHTVYTAVCFIYLDKAKNVHQEYCFSCASFVTFDKINPDLLKHYLQTGDSLDKAGAYGIQGPSLTFISHLDGSYSNVVGFPLSDVVKELVKCLGTQNFRELFK